MRVVTLGCAAILFWGTAGAQVAPVEDLDGSSPTQNIVDLIGDLEGARDPKCYATASRLEDFMYGTPLSAEARFFKNDLQTRLASDVWRRSSELAIEAGRTEIDPEVLKAALEGLPRTTEQLTGGWSVAAADGAVVQITARDVGQYSSVAYGLRAILAARQDALLDARDLPLAMGDDATRIPHGRTRRVCSGDSPAC